MAGCRYVSISTGICNTWDASPADICRARSADIPATELNAFRRQASADRWMPSLRMRDQTVERRMPRRRAAPCGPARTPPVRASARWICWRSISASVRNTSDSTGARSAVQDAEVLVLDDGALAQDDGALHHVGQFPDVAGPGVGGQAGSGQRADAIDGLSHPSREVDHEVSGQQRHVLLPISQRRNVDRKDVEPIEQIGAEVRLAAPRPADRDWWPRSRGCSPSSDACCRAAPAPAPAARAAA